MPTRIAEYNKLEQVTAKNRLLNISFCVFYLVGFYIKSLTTETSKFP